MRMEWGELLGGLAAALLAEGTAVPAGHSESAGAARAVLLLPAGMAVPADAAEAAARGILALRTPVSAAGLTLLERARAGGLAIRAAADASLPARARAAAAPQATALTPAATRIIAASDGGCVKNGKPGAAAGYGACAQLEDNCPINLLIRGRVLPCAYSLRSDGAPGLQADSSGPFVVPSNNRGEYLGFCALLCALLALDDTSGCLAARGTVVEIVLDSKIVMNTMTDWLPARKRRGTQAQLKNFDLVQCADQLLQRLHTRCEIVLSKIKSHRPRPPKDSPALDLARWDANDLADHLADDACKAQCAPRAELSGEAVALRLE